MKKYLFLGLAFCCACSKKEDAAPSYETFTSIGGTLAVAKSGSASYNLSNLQLRIAHSASSDVYEYRGLAGNGDGIDIAFYLDPKRTGSGPYTVNWLGTTYQGGFSGKQVSPEGGNNATYSNPGPNATAKFSGTTYAGTLK